MCCVAGVRLPLSTPSAYGLSGFNHQVWKHLVLKKKEKSEGWDLCTSKTNHYVCGLEILILPSSFT